MSISQKEIIKIRKKLSMTQPELGKELGVSKTTVSNWENGVHAMGVAEEKVLRYMLGEYESGYHESEPPEKGNPILLELVETQKKLIKKLEDENKDLHSEINTLRVKLQKAGSRKAV